MRKQKVFIVTAISIAMMLLASSRTMAVEVSIKGAGWMAWSYCDPGQFSGPAHRSLSRSDFITTIKSQNNNCSAVKMMWIPKKADCAEVIDSAANDAGKYLTQAWGAGYQPTLYTSCGHVDVNERANLVKVGICGIQDYMYGRTIKTVFGQEYGKYIKNAQIKRKKKVDFARMMSNGFCYEGSGIIVMRYTSCEDSRIDATVHAMIGRTSGYKYELVEATEADIREIFTGLKTKDDGSFSYLSGIDNAFSQIANESKNALSGGGGVVACWK